MRILIRELNHIALPIKLLFKTNCKKKRCRLLTVVSYSLLTLVATSCYDNSNGKVDRRNARIDTVPITSTVNVEHVYDGELVDYFLISKNKYRQYVGSYMPENRGEIIKTTADSTTITVKKYIASFFSGKSVLQDSARYYIDNLQKINP